MEKMYKTMTAVLLGMAGMALLTQCYDPKNDTTFQSTQRHVCMGYAEPYQIPLDANLSHVVNHSDTILLQKIADTLSWKTFIALNWPALPNGQPDSNKCIGQYDTGSTTVWEKWTESNQLIGKSGVPVLGPKGDTVWIPKACVTKYEQAKDKEHLLILYKNTVPGSRNGINKRGYKLIDQNSNPIYYDMYYNESMVKYILDGRLNTYEGQVSFTRNWPQLTEGIKLYDDSTLVPFVSIFFSIDVREDSIVQKMNYKMVFKRNTTGAVMTKAAWKILTPSDDPNRFYTRDALVAISKDSCIRTKVGLIGLHIAHKTAEAPQWIWSTFEHVDNAPEMGANGRPILEKDRKYLLFNPKCTDCPYNTPDTSISPKPSQIVKTVPIHQDVKGLNGLYQKMTRQANSNNVWQYYDLAGTQWPFSPSLMSSILIPAYPIPNGNPRPTLLSNTAMESFDQGTSCMSCHANAFILNKVPADFVWGLIKNKKK